MRLEVDEKEKHLGCESSQIPMLLCMVSNEDDDDENENDGENDGKNDGNCTFVA